MKGSGGTKTLPSGAKCGLTGLFEFQARFDQDGPVILARRLPCRCAPCRAVMHGARLEENICVIPEITGLVTKHSVNLKETLTLEATATKKARDKEVRKRKTTEKIAVLSAAAAALRASPELAPNPAAAVAGGAAAAAVGVVADGAAAAGADFAFAVVYGPVDALAAERLRGDNEFEHVEVDENFSDGEGEEEEEEGKEEIEGQEGDVEWKCGSSRGGVKARI